MITHVAQTKQVSKNHRETVQRFLQWDDLKYCSLQYEFGLHLLREIYIETPELISTHERSKLFWQFFINHWSIGEANFVKLLPGWVSKGYKDYQIERQYKHLMHFFCVSKQTTAKAFSMYLKVANHEEK